jgi:hypothetical protein
MNVSGRDTSAGASAQATRQWVPFQAIAGRVRVLAPIPETGASVPIPGEISAERGCCAELESSGCRRRPEGARWRGEAKSTSRGGPLHASDGASVVDAQVSQDGEQGASGREASLHAVWKDTVTAAPEACYAPRRQKPWFIRPKRSVRAFTPATFVIAGSCPRTRIGHGGPYALVPRGEVELDSASGCRRSQAWGFSCRSGRRQ